MRDALGSEWIRRPTRVYAVAVRSIGVCNVRGRGCRDIVVHIDLVAIIVGF